MTNSFENEKNNAIVKAQSQQLAVRNAWLVERGIHSLPIQGITECRIMEFCSIINDYERWGTGGLDLERTLKTIADIGGDIRSNRRYLDLLIFVLLNKYYWWFFYLRKKYRLSGAKQAPVFTRILTQIAATLRALVGSIASPVEAIWDVLFYGTTHFPVPVASSFDLAYIGTEAFFNGRVIPYEEYIRYMTGTPGFSITDTRILAIDWLLDWFGEWYYAYGNNRQRLIATTRDLFSDYLRTMLLSTVQITPFLFKLKYADALINNHVVEAIDFYIDMIKLNKEAGKYIYFLCEIATSDDDIYFCNKISLKTVLYALDKLIESDSEYAGDMFYSVILMHHQDFCRYPDVELEMISRAYNSLSAQFKRDVDARKYDMDELQEYKKLIMAELKRRGLHG